ncbi:MAG: hypothetical protein AB1567_12945 [bacterium]
MANKYLYQVINCKILALLIILILINTAETQPEEYYGHKKKIVIENFYVKLKKAYPESGKLFASKLKSALFNTNRFVVKEAKAIEKSKELAQLTIRGRILKCREEAVIKWYHRPLPTRFRGPKVTKACIGVEIDLCDPDTDVIIKSFRVKGEAKLEGEKLAGLENNKGGKLNPDWQTSALALSINKVTQRIIDIIIEEMDKYKWEAKITQVNGDKLYIDCGLECNIKAGTMLVVHKKNTMDTETIVGETKIIEVNKNSSIGIITKNDGIKPNMVVRMVE